MFFSLTDTCMHKVIFLAYSQIRNNLLHLMDYKSISTQGCLTLKRLFVVIYRIHLSLVNRIGPLNKSMTRRNFFFWFSYKILS